MTCSGGFLPLGGGVVNVPVELPDSRRRNECSGAVATADDADTDDEEFSLDLSKRDLQLSVAMGSPAGAEVRSTDDDGGSQGQSAGETVSLSAGPNPMAEGLPVTVTLTSGLSGIMFNVTRRAGRARWGLTNQDTDSMTRRSGWRWTATWRRR